MSPNLLIAGLTLTGVTIGPAQDANSGWKPLFNGKGLNEWDVRSGEASYRIEDGAIVGKTKAGTPNTFLCTKNLHGDFVLEFDVNCEAGLNSGFQIRSTLKGDKLGGRVNGPQVEIKNSGVKCAEAGYTYGEAAGRLENSQRGNQSTYALQCWRMESLSNRRPGSGDRKVDQR